MQRRPPAGVATVQECCISIEEVANALDIIALYGQMDGMILCRRNWPPAPTDFIEKQSNIFIAPVPGDFDQAVEVTAVPFRFCCARVEQNPHGFGMSFSYGEVDRRRVEAFSTAQV